MSQNSVRLLERLNNNTQSATNKTVLLKRIVSNLPSYIKFYRFYVLTRIKKRCYFEPFTGEFGHLLGHVLPFISHLYSKGVKVNFCGFELHECFFKDESGQSIVNSYLGLRDFYKEAQPSCNRAKFIPGDVQVDLDRFEREAKDSRFPYWQTKNADEYFYGFRWWIFFNRYQKTFDLSKVYKTENENSVVIFPRKWKTAYIGPMSKQQRNNGGNWDYYKLARAVSKYVDKVYVVGHPEFSGVEFSSFDNVEVCLTSDNAVILEKCSNSKLIISQHSGSNYLGNYTDCQVMVIYKGGKTIGGMQTTKAFNSALGKKHPLQIAYSLSEVEKFVENSFSAKKAAVKN